MDKNQALASIKLNYNLIKANIFKIKDMDKDYIRMERQQ